MPANTVAQHGNQPNRRDRERKADGKLCGERRADVGLVAYFSDHSGELRGIRDHGKAPNQTDA